MGDVVLAPSCRSGPLGSILDSSDPVHGAIFRIYCSHLGRQPDRVGFEYWLGVIAKAGSLHPVSYSFLESNEFITTYGELDDARFVDTVYANVLGRADAAGRRYWLDLLGANVERSAVMLAFSESAEFRVTTGTI